MELISTLNSTFSVKKTHRNTLINNAWVAGQCFSSWTWISLSENLSSLWKNLSKSPEDPLDQWEGCFGGCVRHTFYSATSRMVRHSTPVSPVKGTTARKIHHYRYIHNYSLQLEEYFSLLVQLPRANKNLDKILSTFKGTSGGLKALESYMKNPAQ